MPEVSGTYYGNKFSGKVAHSAPNWANGSFKKSEGIHLHVVLDTPIFHYGERKTLWLKGWVDGKTFPWGSCEHQTV